ncbi:MAG TPA: hypothetical protein VGD91_13355, partial [Trebonia sp.]
MGIGQLCAGFTVPAAAPVVVVGEAAIDHTPLAIKEWATATFGTADKTVLLTGVFVVVFIYSAAVGILALRRLSIGYLGLAIFAAIGLAAALTRPNATGGYAVPTLLGAAAGAFALRWLIVTGRAAALAAQTGRAARASLGTSGLPAVGFDPVDRAPETRTESGGGTVAGDAGSAPAAAAENDAVGWVEAGSGAPAGPRANGPGTDQSQPAPPQSAPLRAGPLRGGPPAARQAGPVV